MLMMKKSFVFFSLFYLCFAADYDSPHRPSSLLLSCSLYSTSHISLVTTTQQKHQQRSEKKKEGGKEEKFHLSLASRSSIQFLFSPSLSFLFFCVLFSCRFFLSSFVLSVFALWIMNIGNSSKHFFFFLVSFLFISSTFRVPCLSSSSLSFYTVFFLPLWDEFRVEFEFFFPFIFFFLLILREEGSSVVGISFECDWARWRMNDD